MAVNSKCSVFSMARQDINFLYVTAWLIFVPRLICEHSLHFRVCRSRARNRSDAQRRSGRSRYTRSQQFKTPSPDRRHSHSRPTSRSRTRYPTRIASSSTRQRSPAGLALAMDGFFSPRPNVRRPRERRANGEFLDFVSQTSLEKLTESD